MLIKRHFHSVLILFLIIFLALIMTDCGGRKTISYKRSFTGNASWYGKRFHGRKTANGERFNMYKMTAAHKKLRFGTILLVTNLKNGKSVKVRVNDRGPYARGRVLDLSYAAAKRLGFIQSGHTRVRVKVLR